MQNYFNFLKKYWIAICLSIIILSSFLLMFFSAQTDSMVIDEKVHIPAGYLHVWQGNYLFNSEHPPLLNNLAGLFAKLAHPNVPEIPTNFNGGDQWEYGDMFFYLAGNNVDNILFWARFPFIFLTLGLIYLVFLWARTLFGPKAGLMAAALAAFSPNILAHGRLATTDIGVAFFFLLTCWVLRKYYLKPTLKNAALLGLGIGLALLAKFSGIIILPVVLMGLILSLTRGRSPQGERPRRSVDVDVVAQLTLILIIPLVLIWGVYAFSMRQDLASLPERYELSRTLQYKKLSTTASKWLIVPFDKFSRGFEILSDHNTAGHWSYLNGKVDYTGWWYYFPLVMLYKMTLVEIILLIVAIIFILRPRRQPSGEVSDSSCGVYPEASRGSNNIINTLDGFDKFILVFPPLLFLGISMLGRIDIGIRHILPILPFLYIGVGSLANMPQENIVRACREQSNNSTSRLTASWRFARRIIYTLVIAQIVIGILSFPNYIAYFNQIAGGAKGGLKHLADSNLDWNQNMKRFAAYARQNNIEKVYELCWDGYAFSYQGIKSELLPNTPVDGVVVICAQQLVVPPDGFDFAWVTKYPPDDIISNGVYVWRFDKNPIQ